MKIMKYRNVENRRKPSGNNGEIIKKKKQAAKWRNGGGENQWRQAYQQWHINRVYQHGGEK
jgi:hypothetical protein